MKTIFVISIFLAFNIAYAQPEIISFQTVLNQIVVDGQIDGIKARFIVDTGAGLEIISPSFCKRIGCIQDGSYTGERYPGETVTIALSTMKSISLGSYKQTNVRVGEYPVLDQLPSAFGNIDGILSLKFFEKKPFTINYVDHELILEDSDSLANRATYGTVVPVIIARDNLTLSLDIQVLLNNAKTAVFTVDTGTQHLVVDPDLVGGVTSIALTDAPNIVQYNPVVNWKSDNHGGSVGSVFLSQYATTFDVANGRTIFNKP